MIKRVHHIAFIVEDIANWHELFSEQFAMELYDELYNEEIDVEAEVYDLDGLLLNLSRQ